MAEGKRLYDWFAMPAPFKISPHFTSDKLPVGCGAEPKIDVFEDWMTGWVLRHAHALCAANYNFRQDAGFAILTLVTAYFEPIESYHTGKSSHGKSKLFFRKGFLRVFVNLPATLKINGLANPDQLAIDIADEVYEQLRCGLFHEGGTKNKLMIRADTHPISFMIDPATGDVGSIIIDPCKFLGEVQNHLSGYLIKLRDPLQSPLRANFQKFFDSRMTRSNQTVLPPLIIT